MTIPYDPFEKRVPDEQYRNGLVHIKNYGVYTKNPYQDKGTYTSLVIQPMCFSFKNGFPVITERKIGFWKKPIAELWAFMNGVSDAQVLRKKWGVSWWADQWATAAKCAQFGLSANLLSFNSVVTAKI